MIPACQLTLRWPALLVPPGEHGRRSARRSVLQVMAALHFGAAVALYEIVTRFALVLSNLRPPSGVDSD